MKNAPPISLWVTFCPYLTLKIIGVKITHEENIEEIIPLFTPLLAANPKVNIMITCKNPEIMPLTIGTQKAAQSSLFFCLSWLFSFRKYGEFSFEIKLGDLWILILEKLGVLKLFYRFCKYLNLMNEYPWYKTHKSMHMSDCGYRDSRPFLALISAIRKLAIPKVTAAQKA